MKKNFILSAFEPETSFSPVEVEQIKTVRCEERSDYIWVKIISKDKQESLEINNELVKYVLLAARHQGYSLLNFKDNSSIHVYICSMKGYSDKLPDNVFAKDLKILAWGILGPI